MKTQPTQGHDGPYPTPIMVTGRSVLPEWIDYNGHMNVAYYVLVFDQSLDELLDEIELTRDYRAQSGNTVYVLETHVSYLQEVKHLLNYSLINKTQKLSKVNINLFLSVDDSRNE